MVAKVGSLFAGVEGFGQGMEAAGFDVAWQVEIDKDAVSVLERHYPDTLRFRDIRDVDPSALPPVDVVTFGSPCQDFSVAGKRAGLAGERSGLFGEAIRVIGGLRPAPAFCVWENVPGALSSFGGRDFGAALDALAELGALDIAWRVLDAQWFGVPQRRRRIFLVCDFRGERAAQVLFEPEGSRRDSEACREAGEGAPGRVEDSARSVVSIQYGWRPREYSQGLGVDVGGPSYTLDTMGEHAVGALLPVTGDGVARALNTQQRGVGDPTAETFIVTGTLGSTDLTGNANETSFLVAAPLTAGSHPNSNMPGRRREDDLQATCPGYRGTVEYGKPAHTLHTAGQSVITPMAVRRLTPRECERLMGWPDDWTRYRADGSEISDGARYRLCGNGVVAPVAAWIGRRLRRVMEAV